MPSRARRKGQERPRAAAHRAGVGVPVHQRHRAVHHAGSVCAKVKMPMFSPVPLVVIGGGAAGLMAAVSAAQHGAKVTILEKMKDIGRKILITGKGRCNITNDCEIPEIIKNLPGNGRFLNSALHRFSPASNSTSMPSGQIS